MCSVGEQQAGEGHVTVRAADVQGRPAVVVLNIR